MTDFPATKKVALEARAWGDETRTYAKLDELHIDPANARLHSPRNIDAIVASLREYGQQSPIVIAEDGKVIAGNGRLEAARKLGLEELWVVQTDLSEMKRLGFAIADNRTAELAEWDEEVLASLLETARDHPELDLESTGWTEKEAERFWDAMVTDGEGAQEPEPKLKPAEVAQEKWQVELGDLYQIGPHRLLCGDTTDPAQLARLFGEEKATLIHADPPYGMGKEKDGVANDNLYRAKLDSFQMDWWRAWRKHLEDNGSAYIWGNAPDLWRLWYAGGLADSERLTMRNEVVWDKGGGGMGIGTESQRCYFPTERCLFFMLGEQGFNNNTDNYWEGWEPIRAYLDAERHKCGWSIPKTKEIAGHSPKSGCHWFDRSQWSMPTEETYRRWQKAAKEHDAFKREHDELKREHDKLKREFYATRAPFDNTHDNMTDVWAFPRVTGEERHGHATPKPVAMMERAIKSSSREGDIVAMPFGGTGPDMVAAERTGRRCYGAELQPDYCAVILERMSALGLAPEKVEP